eukprot:4795740-Prymnesium_polylepis.2
MEPSTMRADPAGAMSRVLRVLVVRHSIFKITWSTPAATGKGSRTTTTRPSPTTHQPRNHEKEGAARVTVGSYPP